MTEERVSVESLAALAEGRLAPSARAKVLAKLDSSDDMLEAYSDAVAVLRDLEVEGAATEHRTLWLRDSFRSLRRPRVLATAAILAAAALGPIVFFRMQAAQLDDPGQFVALLSSPSDIPPSAWRNVSWSTTRGASQP